MFEVGLGKELITPARGVPLAGYFNPRPNKGVLDKLQVKAVLIRTEGVVAGIVSFDLIYIPLDIIEDIKVCLRKEDIDFADNVIYSATHTHSGPYVTNLFGAGRDEEYAKSLAEKTVLALKQAYANLSPSRIFYGSRPDNPFAFNRRYLMKDGTVITNPGKLNPDIVRPEGEVDREIGIILLEQEGGTAAIIANLANHTDTIGGDKVSADWPGQMEKYIQEERQDKILVMTLIGPSGNINHVDISHKKEQASYGEAQRIGKGYARIILDTLPHLKELPYRKLSVARTETLIHRRKVAAEEMQEAEAVLKEKVGPRQNNLTSEDLAKGDRLVKRFFAEELIRFKRLSSGKKEKFLLLGLKLGEEIVLISLPGEPFTEIALAIKKGSGFQTTFLVSLANGTCGYIPLKECYERGGYEILPTVGGGVERTTAAVLIKDALGLCKRLRG